MKSKAEYIVFLNKRYSQSDNDYYKKLLKGRITVAADGGIRFFLKNGLKPDILIGDFDSAPRLTKKYLTGIEVIRFPSHKDKTDSQLAVELALERGAGDIKICGALSVSEIDHTLSNIFLLELIRNFGTKNRRAVTASILNRGTEIRLVENESVTLTGRKGDFLSIIPLKSGSKITLEGLDYPAVDKSLLYGDTLSLRNQFKAGRARIKVRGRVLAVVTSKH